MSEAPRQPPTPSGPAFDAVAESAAEFRRRIGQADLTDAEAEALAAEETTAVRRARRDRALRAAR